MRTYVALTSINYQSNGYTALVVGHDKAQVEQKARGIIGDNTNIYADTMHKNLVVLSKTAAKRHGVNLDDAESMCNNHPHCVWM